MGASKNHDILGLAIWYILVCIVIIFKLKGLFITEKFPSRES